MDLHCQRLALGLASVQMDLLLADHLLHWHQPQRRWRQQILMPWYEQPVKSDSVHVHTEAIHLWFRYTSDQSSYSEK